jgi:UDP-4-amino-4-deoxy-L-arabinose formyltransferase/UDP-glucuronic acid dehydrogenase (UDP-4-keto-hexauronic acid decarboxylating)
LIDWSASAESVANLVRAVARPYPGAFSWLADSRITVLKASAGLPRGPGSIGSVWHVGPTSFTVNCGEGSLEVLSYEIDAGVRLRVGDRLQPLERAA